MLNHLSLMDNHRKQLPRIQDIAVPLQRVVRLSGEVLIVARSESNPSSLLHHGMRLPSQSLLPVAHRIATGFCAEKPVMIRFQNHFTVSLWNTRERLPLFHVFPVARNLAIGLRTHVPAVVGSQGNSAFLGEIKCIPSLVL